MSRTARNGQQRPRTTEVVNLMAEVKGKGDQLKGHAKEAVGDLTDNDDLKAEGKADRAAGGIKQKAEEVKDKVVDAVDSVKEKIEKR